MALIVFANIFDAYATFYLINHGGFYESNIWLAWMIKQFGYVPSVGVIKFGWAILFALIIEHLKEPTMLLKLAAALAASIYVNLFFWHIYLFSYTTRFL